MTTAGTSSHSQVTAPTYRGRLFGVVLVAAWTAAFAVSAPAAVSTGSGAPSSGQSTTAS
jgi:hypothetical protein